MIIYEPEGVHLILCEICFDHISHRLQFEYNDGQAPLATDTCSICGDSPPKGTPCT